MAPEFDLNPRAHRRRTPLGITQREQFDGLTPNMRCEQCGRDFHARQPWMTRCLPCYIIHREQLAKWACKDAEAKRRIEATRQWHEPKKQETTPGGEEPS